jgi:hypothetical protein
VAENMQLSVSRVIALFKVLFLSSSKGNSRPFEVATVTTYRRSSTDDLLMRISSILHSGKTSSKDFLIPSNISSPDVSDRHLHLFVIFPSKKIMQHLSLEINSFEISIILAHILKKSREYVLTHPEIALSKTQKAKFRKLINRRKNHEPLAYILGHK